MRVTERIAGIVAPYLEPPRDKALGEPLGELLLGDLLSKF